MRGFPVTAFFLRMVHHIPPVARQAYQAILRSLAPVPTSLLLLLPTLVSLIVAWGIDLPASVAELYAPFLQHAALVEKMGPLANISGVALVLSLLLILILLREGRGGFRLLLVALLLICVGLGCLLSALWGCPVNPSCPLLALVMSALTVEFFWRRNSLLALGRKFF